MSKKKPKKEHTVAPAQYERMLKRYANDIAAHRQVMGAAHEDRELDLAQGAVDAALLGLRADDPLAGIAHLTGFVQGLFLAKRIRTWEYLATDDRRE